MEQSTDPNRSLNVGIVGAGLGGLMAAIAIAEAGANVTVLEAAQELGEIGAGIQMTPNVARFLRRYGVDKEIGENLVPFKELHMRKTDGTKVGYALISKVEQVAGARWWVVHRHHLHTGLVTVARKYGCTIHIDSRISSITYQDSSKPVTVTTMKGTPHSFDLVIGADGVNGFTRRALFPEIVPISPTNNSAYRAIVPYSRLLEDPETRSLVQEGLSMDVWMSDRKYIISYPISAGKDFNMVLSHHTAEPVSSVQDVEKEFVMEQYKEFDPRMRKVISMIEHPIQRWPLLVTGPLKSWSTECKRVVLMGDAAHSMVNHMAQGAATAMEDGVFLGVVIKSVLQGLTSLEQAMKLYEKERMPKARRKQEVSFLNGEIWHLSGEEAARRDAAMKHELDNGGTVLTRSPNLYADPQTVREVYGYDAQTHAVKAVEKETSVKEKMVDRGWRKDIRKETWDDVMGWFVDAKL